MRDKRAQETFLVLTLNHPPARALNPEPLTLDTELDP